jgi:ArsR family transcriptional regulator
MVEAAFRENGVSATGDDADQSLREEMADLHARFCRGIGDPKRLLIIAHLKNGELTVSQLSQKIGAAHSNTSQHLSMMRDLGIVLARRVDNNVFYRLSDSRLADVVDLLRSIQADLRDRPQAASSSARPAPLSTRLVGTGEQPWPR